MTNNPTSGNRPLTGAAQLAELIARQSRPGFSKDAADYRLQRVRFSGDAYNPISPSNRLKEIDPDGFLVDDTATTAAGLPCIILGTLSGCEEVDRVTVDGKPAKQRFMIWSKQPQGTTPVTGKGGGIKTDRGGWINGRYDEVFLLINNRLSYIPLWDAHRVVAAIQQQADPLPIKAMCEVRWQLTKVEVFDSKDEAGNDYFRREPHFELLGLAGQPNGPSEAELANAKRLSVLISQLNYPHPDVPLRLVVNGNPMGEPPASSAPPPSGEGDYAGNLQPPDPPSDFDLPDYLK